MRAQPDSLVGKGTDALPTPALVADADILRGNLAQIAGFFAPGCASPALFLVVGL